MSSAKKEIISGDIILSNSGTWVAKAIIWFQSKQTGSAEYSHVSASIGNELLIESLWRITIGEIKKYDKEKIEVWRLPLSDSERDKFSRGMMKMAGGDYGFGKIFLFAADAVATQVSKLFGRNNPVWFFTEHFGFTNLPVCSQLVMWGFEKFTDFTIRDEAHNRVSWKLISPDYLQDLLRIPHNQAKLIYKQDSFHSL